VRRTNVTRFKAGDEVFGPTLFMRLGNGGAFAEYAAVGEDRLVHKPSHVTFDQAASIPTSGMIALINLRPHRIAREQHVLINGAGGNVGSLALQMAKARGARVTGVEAPSKLELIRSLGADRVIDYTSEDFTTGVERYDLILDVASTSSLSACQPVLTPTGRYCMIGHDHFGTASGRVFGSIPRMASYMLKQSFGKNSQEASFKMPPIAELMETLRQQLESRELTPIIGRVFTLDEVPAAMQCLLEGKTLGRIAISVAAYPRC
jgi:NADPH:quinone reductase-like Zn-dependent oxidoreductase